MGFLLTAGVDTGFYYIWLHLKRQFMRGGVFCSFLFFSPLSRWFLTRRIRTGGPPRRSEQEEVSLLIKLLYSHSLSLNVPVDISICWNASLQPRLLKCNVTFITAIKYSTRGKEKNLETKRSCVLLTCQRCSLVCYSFSQRPLFFFFLRLELWNKDKVFPCIAFHPSKKKLRCLVIRKT